MAGEEEARLRAIRAGAGCFELRDRGLMRVAGSERARWLDGMISADVPALAEPGSGAPGLVLTHQGRLVADVQVLNRGDHFWLEGAASAVDAARAHLDRLIIADDVTLSDDAVGRRVLSLDGAASREIGGQVLGPLDGLTPGGVIDAPFGAGAVAVVAIGGCGLPALRCIVAEADAVALAEAFVAAGAIDASDADHETLRVEHGVPRWGRELDDSVLPAEARLDAAISTTKGCYTGQEVVTRMRSRGRVSHLLVGLSFDTPAAPGTALHHEGRKVGEVTSALVSPTGGAIGLGFLKSDRAEEAPGLQTEGGEPVALRPIPFAA